MANNLRQDYRLLSSIIRTYSTTTARPRNQVPKAYHPRSLQIEDATISQPAPRRNFFVSFGDPEIDALIEKKADATTDGTGSLAAEESAVAGKKVDKLFDAVVGGTQSRQSAPEATEQAILRTGSAVNAASSHGDGSVTISNNVVDSTQRTWATSTVPPELDDKRLESLLENMERYNEQRKQQPRLETRKTATMKGWHVDRSRDMRQKRNSVDTGPVRKHTKDDFEQAVYEAVELGEPARTLQKTQVNEGRANDTESEHYKRPLRRHEDWQVQKDALKNKFGQESWNPRKKLSPDAMEGIRNLHERDPERYSTPLLAEQFKVSPEAIRRILKSKWRASPEVLADRRERWARRHDRIWDQQAELGLRPQRTKEREVESPDAFDEDLRARQMLKDAANA